MGLWQISLNHHPCHLAVSSTEGYTDKDQSAVPTLCWVQALAAGECEMGNDSVRSDKSPRHRSKVIGVRIVFTMFALPHISESYLRVQVVWTYGWHWPGSSAVGGTLLHCVA